ncbi:MAG: hypothetical protein KC461_12855 [Dehalococcoidia bacterium]|nr:hypothetical protein [Dehalococcoidia bacterium]MCA9851518.1 hypothetical protein [Dehalococcoidia bacterium]MCB9483033.1 hypothetical protein [Dehalococcoidia bacterium]MCB9490865.1 hypothetical protein [Dehalococcoidia bacterium]
MVRRLIAAASGLLLAVSMPAFALAAEGHAESTFDAHSRALDPSADWTMIMTLTALTLGGLFLLTTIGYMYRRQRNLDWQFQKPDAPHDDHH